jgi:hypothetical protein
MIFVRPEKSAAAHWRTSPISPKQPSRHWSRITFSIGDE